MINIKYIDLRAQYENIRDEVKDKIDKILMSGNYILSEEVTELEKRFAECCQTRYAIGVGSGTDALFLSLKALNIGQGDEVITTPYTFYATIGAIAATGATPVFVDIREDYNIDPSLIPKAITKKTRAIIPVHWTGLLCDMDAIMKISQEYNLPVIEDACQAINAMRNRRMAGSFGITGCFSLHPLKNINVWGDGGVIVTGNDEIYNKLILLRNHGLRNRDECVEFAYNSRLDSLQAIVANHVLKKVGHITESRIKNAQVYDEELSTIPEIIVPKRDSSVKQVFHIYVVRAKERNRLQEFLINKSIDAKIHYPIPIHLQPAAKYLGYKQGDFPLCEEVCRSVISLPVHEFITEDQRRYVIEKIREFYHD